ncbi:MAG: CPBP family intramembrane metalloprotease [Oscillospiraceae bacterium]|nr:CPBP family intramembrane metalloprotease [Oscillospiraceae bacterium]
MAKYRQAIVFTLCLLPLAIAAGIFVCLYQFEMLPADIMNEAIAQLGSRELLIVIASVQTAAYALVCGFFGCIMAEKLGLWMSFRIEIKSLAITLAISIVGGAVFSLDYWVFGGIIDGVKSAAAESLTAKSIIASVLYGGIIEEVMLRLCVMSLIALGLWKIFYKGHERENIPTRVFVIANIVAAMLFAALHLPATMLTFGSLSGIILFRCFLLNGGFGLIFGFIYRKYGILYAMIAHALFHIVCKLIWFIFI